MRIRILALALIVLMAAPAATAGWMAKGIYEPDTLRDVQDGWMRTQPDESPDSTRRVYFNAFTGSSEGQLSMPFNPNSGMLRSGYASSAGRAFAMLGIWKDCNTDGYVGWGDNALHEYRSELLTIPNMDGETPRNSVCAVQPLPAFYGCTGIGAERKCDHDGIVIHNDGTWVREFIPIGWEAVAGTDNHPYNINDSGARVWWDWGLPEDRTRTRCYAFPPQDSFHSTGGLLEYVDCFVAFKITDAVNTPLPVDADGTPAGQLTFKDQPRDQSESASKANVANPWGDEGGRSYVEPWDCTSAQIRPHGAIAPLEQEVGVSRPRAPPTIRTSDATIGGTVNETATGLDDCDRSDNGNGSPQGGSEWEHQVASVAYGLEFDIVNTKSGKNQAGYTMAFYEGTRNGRPENNPQVLGRATPRDLGVRNTQEAEGFWVSQSRIGETYNPLVDRESQRAQRVTYTSVYAFVSSNAITKYSLQLQGTTGVYGSEHCNGLTPITGEWECDPDKWWLNPDGTRADRTDYFISGSLTFIAALPGDAYNIRDIDCYDFSAKALRDEGVHYGVLTDTACERPPLE